MPEHGENAFGIPAIRRQRSFPHDLLAFSPSVVEYLATPRSRSVRHHDQHSAGTIRARRGPRKVSFCLASNDTSSYRLKLSSHEHPSRDPAPPTTTHQQLNISSTPPCSRSFPTSPSDDNTSRDTPSGESTVLSSSQLSRTNNSRFSETATDHRDASWSAKRQQRRDQQAGPSPLSRLMVFLRHQSKASHGGYHDGHKVTNDNRDDRPVRHFFEFVSSDSKAVSDHVTLPCLTQTHGAGTTENSSSRRRRRNSRFKDTKRKLAKVGALIGLARSPTCEMLKKGSDETVADRGIGQRRHKGSLVYFEISCIGRSIGKVYFEVRLLTWEQNDG